MKPESKIKIKIMQQGSVNINRGIIYKLSENKDIVTVLVDCKTKRTDITCLTSGRCPGLQLEITEDSVNINKKYKNRDTWIVFPEFKNYDMFNAMTSKYTLFITFVKNK